MPTIRQLPQSLVNKIAAGEVIERPASVVKELLENSIDAGATRIELAIEGGGIDRIRISDNGCGIAADQIPLAIASHATSKLESADDLFDVHTLGFRGEALASIAEISHLSLRTRIADSDAGAELVVEGGRSSSIEPVGCPVGTAIEVRNLFFNTPVRRKFLRTPQTEAGHITEAFTRIALAFPAVHMTMTSGNRTLFELPATETWRDRIRSFFGEEVADSLIAVESEQEHARLSGFVADPSVSRSNNRTQYLFLNGRHIRDRSLQHALGEAYRGLMMVGRFPVCFLRLWMNPSMVDVNVHPTKMEVRFQEGGKVYSQLLQTLRHQFLTTDLTARARHVPGPVPKGLQASSAAESDVVTPPAPADELRWESHADHMSQVSSGTSSARLDLTATVPPFRPFADRGTNAIEDRRGFSAPQPRDTAEPTIPQGAEAWDAAASPPATSAAAASPERSEWASGASVPPATQHDAHTVGHSHLGYQIHNRYLVTQDEQGMVLIDQHALHERILYEQLREKTESRSLESQQLLVPEPLDLSPSEAAAALDSREVLAKIGIHIEPFGGDTVLMTSYPAMLANMRPVDVLRQVLEPLMSGGHQPSARDVLDELLRMIACKAAIKAGDKLSPDEITSLLEQRYHFQDSHHCPHGRPTALFFSREQLDKMFKRT